TSRCGASESTAPADTAGQQPARLHRSPAAPAGAHSRDTAGCRRQSRTGWRNDIAPTLRVWMYVPDISCPSRRASQKFSATRAAATRLLFAGDDEQPLHRSSTVANELQSSSPERLPLFDTTSGSGQHGFPCCPRQSTISKPLYLPKILLSPASFIPIWGSPSIGATTRLQNFRLAASAS